MGTAPSSPESRLSSIQATTTSSHIPPPNMEDFQVRISLPSNFKVIKTIGSGSYGRVSKVQHIKTGKYYAQKELIGTNEELETIGNIFYSEVNVLAHLQYPTVLSLYSISIGPPYQLYTEFVENGSVDYYINLSYKGTTPDIWNFTEKNYLYIRNCSWIKIFAFK